MAVKPTEEQRRYFEQTAAGRAVNGKTGASARTFGTMLEEAGLISREMLKDLIPADESAATLKQTLVNQGMVREDDIMDVMSAHLGYEKVSLKSLVITPELLGLIEARHAVKYRVFPVKIENDTLYIALADPLNIQTTDDLERIYHKPVVPLVGNESEIEKFIAHYYEGNDITAIYGEMTEEAVAAETKADEDDKYSNIDLTSDENVSAPPVVKFVDLIFKQAVHDRASDIHVEPTKTGMTIRFRIDGVLHEVPAPPKKWQKLVISRLKVLGGMDLAERRIPLDGRIKLNIPGKKLDVRVSSIPSIWGESIVMRLLDQSSVLMGLEDVGFLPETVTRFKALIKSPNGVILLTGPTGSGKTTTLYSALSTINNVDTKIITTEDPVEYMLDGINQVQINKEIGLDFTLALRSILRQSPDVIMVGEMRDLETAEIGIRAALTGHLVFSTLHTNDAPSACVRLVDMGVKPFMVASSVQAVIAQRLLRRVCTQCKQVYKPAPAEVEAAGYEYDEYADVDFFKGDGCERCSGSGFRGRTAIHEIFTLDPFLRQMVIRVEAGSKLKKEAIKRGMQSLRMDGWKKAQLGMTSVSEVVRITVED